MSLMGSIELLLIAAVIIIVAVAAFETRLGVAAPILLVVVGAGCSLIPGIEHPEFPPELILTVVLPPLLYAAAVNMPVTDFRRNIGPISLLSVGLVLVSAVVIGLVLSTILPGLSLAAGIALGAVISPPDAVAATSIGKRLGLPPRLLTILEGEGLVNDATALVLLRTAIAATAGAFSFWGAAGDFTYAVAVAVVIGLLVGLVSVIVRSQLNQPVLSTAISFVVPFLAFIPAEEVHASGVLAVVVAGLVTGSKGLRKLSPQDRASERTNWRTLQLLLENGVFLMMGFQVTDIIGEVGESGLGVNAAVWLGLLCVVILGVIRLAFVIPVILGVRRRQRRSKDSLEMIARFMDQVQGDERFQSHPRASKITRSLRRRRADALFAAQEGLGWRGGAVLAWSGMRGVVTLAAAQSLPTEFPHRAELILIAFTVAIVTLVGQGGTLPLLIRWLGVRGTDQDRQNREYALLVGQLVEASLQVVNNPELHRSNGQPFDPEVVEAARKQRENFPDFISRMREAQTEEDSTFAQHQELQRMLLEAEQAALHEARSAGAFSSATLTEAQHLMDRGMWRGVKDEVGH